MNLEFRDKFRDIGIEAVVKIEIKMLKFNFLDIFRYLLRDYLLISGITDSKCYYTC